MTADSLAEIPVRPMAEHRLQALFRPRSIALVGATERSVWSNGAFGNLDRFGFAGDIHLVNRRGGTVYGRQALATVTEIDGGVDLALLMVPHAAIGATIDEIAGLARNAIVLTSGFAEKDEDGRRQQDEIVARARACNLTLLGPNSLGFLNFADNIPVWTNFRRRQRQVGSIALVSQSGAISNLVADFGFRQQIPFSFIVSTGNQADVDQAEVLDFLADEPATRVVALFVEGVPDGPRFAAAAERVRQAGKPIVLLKVGAGDISAKAAQAHTGALVGDDRIFDAACRRLGMIRVTSLEDLLLTADLLVRVGPIAGSRVGFSSMSGGLCEIAADRLESEGLAVPDIADETRRQLVAALPDFGTPRNPLDLTGAALLDPSLFRTALGIFSRDPGLDLLLCAHDGPETDKDHPLFQEAFDAIGAGLAQGSKPAIVFTNLANNLTAAARAGERQAGLVYAGAGLDRGVTAAAHAIRWWERKRLIDAAPAPPLPLPVSGERPRLEREVLDYIGKRGVPVIPAVLAKSSQEAIAAATTIGEPLALKIVSPQIVHKSDVGGVALNVAPKRVGAAYDAMLARVRIACPDAPIDGVLVSPMRGAGIELFVGTVRDPVWGPAITVGFGGVAVEIMKDTALRLLPVSEADVVEMLGDLRGRPLLDGFRGAPPADIAAIARVVKAIGDAALSLGEKLVSLEINPLLVTGSRIEALDGLAIWEDEGEH